MLLFYYEHLLEISYRSHGQWSGVKKDESNGNCSSFKEKVVFQFSFGQSEMFIPDKYMYIYMISHYSAYILKLFPTVDWLYKALYEQTESRIEMFVFHSIYRQTKFCKTPFLTLNMNLSQFAYGILCSSGFKL